MSGERRNQKRAGRGGLALLTANILFMMTGFVQRALLPRDRPRGLWRVLARVGGLEHLQQRHRLELDRGVSR